MSHNTLRSLHLPSLSQLAHIHKFRSAFRPSLMPHPSQHGLTRAQKLSNLSMSSVPQLLPSPPAEVSSEPTLVEPFGSLPPLLHALPNASVISLHSSASELECGDDLDVMVCFVEDSEQDVGDHDEDMEKVSLKDREEDMGNAFSDSGENDADSESSDQEDDGSSDDDSTCTTSGSAGARSRSRSSSLSSRSSHSSRYSSRPSSGTSLPRAVASRSNLNAKKLPPRSHDSDCDIDPKNSASSSSDDKSSTISGDSSTTTSTTSADHFSASSTSSSSTSSTSDFSMSNARNSSSARLSAHGANNSRLSTFTNMSCDESLDGKTSHQIPATIATDEHRRFLVDLGISNSKRLSASSGLEDARYGPTISIGRF
ncbi:hypothetical protein PQX77_011710 [Marasmius sp. AFHP31]|nr:hypothetical protein PQX77_011710 [Marasmius sp. AFHP31]